MIDEWQEQILILMCKSIFKDFYEFLEKRTIYLKNFSMNNHNA